MGKAVLLEALVTSGGRPAGPQPKPDMFVYDVAVLSWVGIGFQKSLHCAC